MGAGNNTDRLSRYIMIVAGLAFFTVLCWYFREVLVYVLVAAVVALIGRPVMQGLQKCRIKGRKAPDWLLAILTIIIIYSVLAGLLFLLVPVVSSIARNVGSIFTEGGAVHDFLSSGFSTKINDWVKSSFPAVGSDFSIQTVGLEAVKKVAAAMAPAAMISSVIGGVTSFAVSLFIGIFSVTFISFFFIKDDKLVGKIISALVPDKFEEKTRKAMYKIENLLSRYFVGIIIETAGVALLDFLGLWAIAKMSAGTALGIAFIAGILNVIPYVGPLMGEVIGVIFGMALCLGGQVGLDVNVWVYALIVLACMLATQLADNFFFQPLIYSTSIKSKPLEIFLILLVAGFIGGMVGMLVAIPVYTILRVIAFTFFPDVKFIRKMKESSGEDDESRFEN